MINFSLHLTEIYHHIINRFEKNSEPYSLTHLLSERVSRCVMLAWGHARTKHQVDMVASNEIIDCGGGGL